MCKLGELDAVLFAHEALFVAAFADVVDLQCLVASRREQQLTVVIVVYGEDVWRGRVVFGGIVSAEELSRC